MAQHCLSYRHLVVLFIISEFFLFVSKSSNKYKRLINQRSYVFTVSLPAEIVIFHSYKVRPLSTRDHT